MHSPINNLSLREWCSEASRGSTELEKMCWWRRHTSHRYTLICRKYRRYNCIQENTHFQFKSTAQKKNSLNFSSRGYRSNNKPGIYSNDVCASLTVIEECMASGETMGLLVAAEARVKCTVRFFRTTPSSLAFPRFELYLTISDTLRNKQSDIHTHYIGQLCGG